METLDILSTNNACVSIVKHYKIDRVGNEDESGNPNC
jgi:hypothetical protein